MPCITLRLSKQFDNLEPVIGWNLYEFHRSRHCSSYAYTLDKLVYIINDLLTLEKNNKCCIVTLKSETILFMEPFCENGVFDWHLDSTKWFLPRTMLNDDKISLDSTKLILSTAKVKFVEWLKLYFTANESVERLCIKG